ncbi:MAG: DMT family transporter [Acidimicrobiales bacterium]
MSPRARAGLGIPVLRCLGAAMLFAASAPAASKLAGTVPSVTLAGLLYLGAGLGVAPFVRRWRSGPARSSGALVSSEWVALSVAVLAGGALGPVLLVAGLARTSAASASILLNLELAATVLFAWALFREHVGPVLGGSAMLITASGAVLAWAPGASLDAGALLVGGACLCWGLDNVVTARIERLSPAQVVVTKGLVAGGANVLLGVGLYGNDGVPGVGAVLAAVAIGTAGYGWSILLWVKGARDLGAARAQVCFSTAPFVGAGLAWVTFSEGPTVSQGVAMAVAAVGVLLSLASAHAHPHHHPPVRHVHEHRHPDAHHDDSAHHDPERSARSARSARSVRRHTHEHGHDEQRHEDPHVPDLHHRHDHERATDPDPS